MLRQAPQHFNHSLLRCRLERSANLGRTCSTEAKHGQLPHGLDNAQLISQQCIGGSRSGNSVVDWPAPSDIDFLSFNSINEALKEIADSFAERLSLVNRKFSNALVWGYQPELLIDALQNHNCLPHNFIIANLAPKRVGDMAYHSHDLTGQQEATSSQGKQKLPPYSAVLADQELLPFADKSFDLVLSFCNLQWTNDLPGMLSQIQMALKPDGLFQAVMPGGNSLIEIRESIMAAELQATGGAAARVAPFMQLHNGASLMQRAQFALCVIDIERLKLSYRSLMYALRDFRAGGLSHIPVTPPAILSKETVRNLRQNSQPQQVSLEMIYMSGWRPSACQPKPIKRGSAQKLLADFL